jgi:hypothetical protein
MRILIVEDGAALANFCAPGIASQFVYFFGPVRIVSFGSSKSLRVPAGADR